MYSYLKVLLLKQIDGASRAHFSPFKKYQRIYSLSNGVHAQRQQQQQQEENSHRWNTTSAPGVYFAGTPLQLQVAVPDTETLTAMMQLGKAGALQCMCWPNDPLHRTICMPAAAAVSSPLAHMEPQPHKQIG